MRLVTLVLLRHGWMIVRGHKTFPVCPVLHLNACLAQVVLKRALQDVMGQLPAVEVAIALPAIKASLSDYEYQLITSVAGANLGEVALFRVRLARCSLGMHEGKYIYSPTSFD